MNGLANKPFRTVAFLAAILFFTLSVTLRLKSMSAPPASGLVPAVPSLDLGEVAEGESLLAEFKLCNRTCRPIHLIQSLASCSCTAMSFSRRTLQPSESASLVTTWNPSSTGPTATEVRIISMRTDLARPCMEDTILQIRATVLPK